MEYAILALALAGAILAFLKYNITPAQIFMGDTGSLIIGLVISILSIRFIDLNHGLPLAKVLSHYCGVERHAIEGLSADETHFAPIEVPGIEGIRFHPMPLKSKAPPYSPHRNNPGPGDNNGLMIESIATGKKVFYAPGLGEIEPHVLQAMQQADCVLVDGTVWTGDEMITLGLTQKTAADMGHLQVSGPGGMIEVLEGIGARRKVLIHINNTNPILNEDSAERATLAQHGIEVAFDGMEIEL
jgi:pyrroloquinoline quinone biosynthesis protein B